MKKQVNEPIISDFFLGATTSLGFKSSFETLRDEDMQLVLLKGAPCDYSNLLAAYTAHSAYSLQRIHHPQAPAQLVGVVREGQAGCDAILDANGAHAILPLAAGACEQVIGLYDAIHADVLAPHVAELKTLLARIDCLQTRAARYITSIGGLLFDSRRAASCVTDFEKLATYATHLCERTMPQTQDKGHETKRFLSAITPCGNLCYTDTIAALASHIIVFQDEYGAASKVLCETVRRAAIARGYDIIVCPCALFSDEKIEHIIIPSLGLAFVTSNTWHPMTFAHQQNIHCSRFMDAQALKSYRSRLRFNTKAAGELQTQCADLLAQIEACNQRIHAIYQEAVDGDMMAEKLGVRMYD